MILQLVLIIIFIAIIIYLQNMWKIYTYWKKRGVTGPTPYPVVGNYRTVFFGLESEAAFLQKIYEQYPNEKFVGLYKGVKPILVVRDPDVIKSVLIRDFDKFHDRCIATSLHIFKKGIFTMRGGARWQAIRSILSPNFTKSKITKMIPYVQKAADKFLEFVDYLVDNKIEHEMSALSGKYMIEIIGNLIFGVNIDAIQGNIEFQTAIKALLNPKLQASPILTTEYVCPPIMDMLKPVVEREYDRRVLNGIRKFVNSLIYMPRVNKTVNFTFIENLIDLKENCRIKNGREIQDILVDDDDIIQQCLTFSLATYESTSTIMSYMIYELALNQDIQDKCNKEIMTVFERYNGELTFKALQDMKYLEMTLDESLRLHPTSHCLDRKCVSEYTFPNTNLTIDKGIYIFLPSHGLQLDPKYFPNPDVFNPERFSPENKANIPSCVYMPFGDGPRMCMGRRLGKVYVLMYMASILKKYKFTPCAKTYRPMRYDPMKWFVTACLGGVWVNIHPRE